MVEFNKNRFDSLFSPKSIAIVGISRNFMKWGDMIFANIISENYLDVGKLYLINPKYDTLLNYKVYPSISSLPETVDLVYITLPAKKSLQILQECGENQIKNVIIIAGGFKEIGNYGENLENQIRKIAERYNIYLVGPNTMGISNPWSNFHGLMPKVVPKPGSIAMISQSGNLGTQLLNLGLIKGVGFSKFVCSGNETVLKFEDYLQYFGMDEKTKVIICYIEGLQDPLRFKKVASQIKKPIIVYKAGKTETGGRAAISHTGKIYSPIELYRSIFKQVKIIEVEKTIDLLHVAWAFSVLPPLKGTKIGVVSWGGGWGVVTTDLLTDAGFDVSPLSSTLINELNKLLPPFWSKNNPIDCVGSLNRRSHGKIIKTLAESKEFDGIIVLGIFTGSVIENYYKYTDLLGLSKEEIEVFLNDWNKSDKKIEKIIKNSCNNGNIPIIVVSLLEERNKKYDLSKIVKFPYPEDVIIAFKKLFKYYNYHK
ncbi:MAG: CoA-binding protein [Candidatus Helarchaeota archaeon]